MVLLKSKQQNTCAAKSVCCIMNNGYSCQATTYKLTLQLGLFQKTDSNIFLYIRLPLHVALIFAKFGELIVNNLIHKRVFGFPPFCYGYLFIYNYLFYLQLLQSPSKTKNTVKDINQNSTSNKLDENKKKNPNTFRPEVTNYFFGKTL